MTHTLGSASLRHPSHPKMHALPRLPWPAASWEQVGSIRPEHPVPGPLLSPRRSYHTESSGCLGGAAVIVNPASQTEKDRLTETTSPRVPEPGNKDSDPDPSNSQPES